MKDAKMLNMLVSWLVRKWSIDRLIDFIFYKEVLIILKKNDVKNKNNNKIIIIIIEYFIN